jgi:hypothetical protein
MSQAMASWLAQLRLVGGDANVAGHGQLAPSAQRKPVDRSDDRLGQLLRRFEDAERLGDVELIHASATFELGNVGTGHERLVPRAPHDHDPDVVVPRELLEHLHELLAHGLVEGVQLVRPVDGDGGDAVGDID